MVYFKSFFFLVTSVFGYNVPVAHRFWCVVFPLSYVSKSFFPFDFLFDPLVVQEYTI